MLDYNYAVREQEAINSGKRVMAGIICPKCRGVERPDNRTGVEHPWDDKYLNWCTCPDGWYNVVAFRSSMGLSPEHDTNWQDSRGD